jgi:hypothetical protein
LLKIFGGPISDGEHSTFATFSMRDEEGSALTVVVGKIKCGEFASANPGGVKQFQDSSVSKTEGTLRVRQGKEAFDVRLAECFGKADGALLWKMKLGGRIRRDHPITPKGSEKSAQAAKSCDLRLNGERLAGAWRRLPEEVILIALKVIPGDRREAGEALRACPFSECLEGNLMHLEGWSQVATGPQAFDKVLGLLEHFISHQIFAIHHNGSAFTFVAHSLEISGAWFSCHDLW